jgi:hypothetical protein
MFLLFLGLPNPDPPVRGPDPDPFDSCARCDEVNSNQCFGDRLDPDPGGPKLSPKKAKRKKIHAGRALCLAGGFSLKPEVFCRSLRRHMPVFYGKKIKDSATAWIRIRIQQNALLLQ